MVIDKEVLKEVKETFRQLPGELQTYENFEKIEKLLKV